jgi:long-chain fatty acid transport protein
MSRRVAILYALPVFAFALPAHASGLYLQEQSAKDLGRGFSGGAASADDASTIFFNPAGMTELGQVNTSINAQALFVDTKQTNNGSTRSIPGVPTAVATGGNSGGNPFKQPVTIPAGYVSFRINQSPIWVGLGVSVPYGVQVKYDDGFFGRYDSTNSDVRVVNINPSIAWKVNDNFSVGAGLDIQQMDVTLENALPNVSPLQADGALKVKGDDLAFGWNVGMLATEGKFRFGASYRSRVKHSLTGYYQVTGLAAPLAAGNVRLSASAPITLPDSATVSAMYGVGERFRLMATGKWFNWSVFKNIAIYPNGGTAAISAQNYKDSWSGALGAEYDVSPRLTLRAGTLYDTTPTVDQYRSTRVPDGDRTWATAGLGFKVNKNVEVNLSYAHVFIKTEPLNRTDLIYAGTAAQITSVTRSTNTGNADEVAASMTFKL